MIITLYTAALLGLLYFYLSAHVIRRRLGMRIALGNKGDGELERRIRAHANLMEYAPICLILIYLCESTRVSIYWVGAIAAMLVIGRCMHAASMLYFEPQKNTSNVRIAGMVLTLLCLLSASVTVLVKAIGASL